MNINEKRKPRNRIIAIVACLLVLTLGLALGKYVFPNGLASIASADDNVVAAEPVSEDATDIQKIHFAYFEMLGDTIKFMADTTEDGMLYFYDAEDPTKVVATVPAKFENNYYKAEGVPEGNYDRIDFVVSTDGFEGRGKLAMDIEFSDDGSSLGTEPFDAELKLGMPDTLEVFDIDMIPSEDGRCEVTANSSLDGTLTLYPAIEGASPINLPAKFEGYKYVATGVPYGAYTKIELSVTDGKESREALAAEYAYYDENGCSVNSSELEGIFLYSDYKVDEEKLEKAIDDAMLSRFLREYVDQGYGDYKEDHKIWGYDIKDFCINVYITSKFDLYTENDDGTYSKADSKNGPCCLIFSAGKKGEYILEKDFRPYEENMTEEEREEWMKLLFPEDLIPDLTSVDYSSDF